MNLAGPKNGYVHSANVPIKGKFLPNDKFDEACIGWDTRGKARLNFLEGNIIKNQIEVEDVDKFVESLQNLVDIVKNDSIDIDELHRISERNSFSVDLQIKWSDKPLQPEILSEISENLLVLYLYYGVTQKKLILEMLMQHAIHSTQYKVTEYTIKLFFGYCEDEGILGKEALHKAVFIGKEQAMGAVKAFDLEYLL